MNTHDMLSQRALQEAGVSVCGDGFGDFDPKFLIDTAAELSKRGVDTYQDDQKKQKDQAQVAMQLQKAIAADANWANAEAMLTLANESHNASQIAPAQALQSSAMSAAMSAGTGLPSDAVAKRVAAAQDAANKAAQDALANPSDALKQATMRGWQKVLAAAGSSGTSLSPSGGGRGHVGGGNWLTKKWGPMPVWGWGVTTLGVVTAGVLVVKMLRK